MELQRGIEPMDHASLIPLNLGPSVSLVCEGACNPQIVEVDAAVRDASRWGRAAEGVMLPIDAPIASALRTLRHTVHMRRESGRWECLECGYSRAYGAEAGR